MNNIVYEDIKSVLPEHDVIGELSNISFKNIHALDKGIEGSLVFIAKERSDSAQLILQAKASVILAPKSSFDKSKLLPYQVVILVDNPKVAFSEIGNKFFVKKVIPGIHPSAHIHPETRIGNNVHIGSNVSIGKGSIGNNCIIYSNVVIHDSFSIGNNVKIGSGTVIGSEGFGYNKNEQNIAIQFPHIGDVRIEDNVEIGANTCIDKGALDTTWIMEGVKIDNLVHIAHNVKIGKNSYIIANVMIGGSTNIGENVYIAPSVSLRDQLKINNGVTLGLGATVLKDVPENETWTGSPAMNLTSFLEWRNKIRNLK